MEINPVEDDIQIDSIEEEIIEVADKEDIIEIFTENSRHVIKNIPIVANLDLGEEDDSESCRMMKTNLSMEILFLPRRQIRSKLIHQTEGTV